MFSNIIAGAAGFPVADLGDTINQSLRFSGSQNLTKTMAAGAETTFSCWVKIANLSQTSAMAFIGATSGSNYVQFFWEGATYETLGADNSNTSYAYTSNKLRDASAWYHLVYVRTSSDTKVYINGAEASYRTSAAGSNGALSSTTFAIGSLGNGTSKLEGYMADVHFVESVKQPSDFGRYQEDGVWVPKNYTGTYGTNGFHLDFADSSNLGNDVSGNNNDFTASGFDTADIALYSKDLSTPTGFNSGSQSAAAAFDGDTSTTCFASGAGAVGKTITWAPSTAISFTTLEALNGGNQNYQLGSGSLVTSVANTFTTVATNGTVSASNPFKTISTNSGTTPTLNAIRIDGTILVDNTDNDVDYEDTPTSNYPTINSLYPSTDPPEQDNAIEGNLGYTGKANRFGTGATTMALPSSGEYYWEHEVVTHADHQYFGVTRMPSIASGSTTGFISFRAYEGSNWYVYQDSTLLTTGTAQITDGDVIGQAYNVDTGVYRVYINGTLAATNTWTLRPTDEELFVFGSLEAKNSNKFRVNYGQRDFIYTPPTGAKRLHTNNLPEPTIKNGSDHFQAITDTGANILTSAQAAFSNGLYWIKDRDNSNTQHQLVDTVRGTSATIKKSPGLANNAAYSAPSGNSIAWCWNAPDEMDQTTRESGDINVTAGRVNQDAGFSILEFTGNSTNGQTVAHGLTQAPEFMIAIAQGNTNSMPCWHGHASGAPNAATSLLNGSTSFTLTHVAAVSDQFITIQGNTAINDTDTMSMYLWHSVPGYSAFGRYSGNQSSDGVFIYTGFSPRFIILKGANLTSDWILLDSSRSIANPRNASLYSNYNLDEQISSTLDVDFLSNGFKLRTNNATLNQGYEYCYSCWAEHPFGGENTAPATAR